MKKPKLSPKHAKARLAFAREHLYWTEADWKTVIFSDETKINRFSSDGRSWYWASVGEGLSSRAVVPTVKHGGGSVMAWGCITAHGARAVCQVHGRMNKEMYIGILAEHLPAIMNGMPGPSRLITFQHDNDPKHTARATKEWLDGKGYRVMKWPAYSPDLNPIEHMWAQLKRGLNKRPTAPSGLVESWDRIEEEYRQISDSYISRLYKSMPARMKAVVKARGYWTKY